jgi:hypothetical protein
MKKAADVIGGRRAMDDAKLDYAPPQPRAALPWRMTLIVAVGIVLGIAACLLLTVIYYNRGVLSPE